ncbi:serine hydrolase [Nocardia panacis]|uniref:Serine hydrolase n=1 Tax=Nocardia panacis TaxID=2340916 RepID=A0A3A4KLE3_9NOCA|nr:serine hydrolase [Nocardia panacis]RJO75641.1 serine hydrolase [Nocardia panacis]
MTSESTVSQQDSTPIRLGLEHLARIPLLSEPAISPDGTRIVYALRTVDSAADKDIQNLWQVRPGSDPIQLTRGNADRAPSWSPDGRTLAFLRAADGAAQIWLLPADGGEPERVTELPLGAGAPHWSPDGTRIAFTAPVDTSGASMDPGAPNHIVRGIYKMDGVGWLRDLHTHLFVLDLGDKSVRQLTEGSYNVDSPTWSPDSARIAFVDALPDGDAYDESAARIIAADSPRTDPPRIGPLGGAVAAVVWKQDGTGLLGLTTPDTGVRNVRLSDISLDGGETVELTAGFDRNLMQGGPGYPGALPRQVGDAILFCARDEGCTHLYRHDATGIRKLIGGERAVSGLSVAGDKVALIVATTDTFGEIVLLDPESGAEQVLTSHTETALPEVQPIRAQERKFTISDGVQVQGWIVRDPAARTPGPLLLDVHGGPHNSWNPVRDWIHVYHQILAARGWTILLLNPRGSDGYGEEFMRGTNGGWGTADERDFLEPIDELVAEGLADPKRLALSGYSYGGFTACRLPTRTDRFAAAVTGGPVSDLESFIGTSDFGHHLGKVEVEAMPWSDPKALAEMNPFAHVAKVKTPTLVLQGDAESRCPIGQGEQWYNALRDLGVPTEFVVYPGASHLFIFQGKPSHRIDFNRRIVDWVIRYTRAAGPKGAAEGKQLLNAEHWQRRLTELATRYEVPGVVLGISLGDSIIEAAHGVLSLDTQVPTTVDSVFQIGSISKVWTATAAMRLIDQGKLALETPVLEIIPELRHGDSSTLDGVTIRHLLTHTSGLDGDLFGDTGRGDDCLEKYVADLGESSNHPVGATFSYCNAGFGLLGRIIEVLTGSTWDTAMRELIFEPLGLTHTMTLPEEALMHRAAVGHMTGPDGVTRPAHRWDLPRNAGPAGAIVARARDLLTFARLHLDGGVAPDGTRLLSEESVRRMQAEEVALPFEGWAADSWGLGWFRMRWSDELVIGHDGGTIGQAAMLRVVPELGLAFTLLTNGGSGVGPLTAQLMREIAADLADLRTPEPFAPAPEPPQVDLDRHVGVYERAGVRTEVFKDEDGLVLRTKHLGAVAEMLRVALPDYRLVPVTENLFAASPTGKEPWMSVTFYTLEDGSPYVHYGVRAQPKVSAES